MQIQFSRFAGRLLLASLTLAPFARADLITSFPNFSSTDGLTLVDSASSVLTADGAVLRLTPAGVRLSGAAYSTSPITLGAGDIFSTQFQFRISDAGGLDPADGFTFVLSAGHDGLGGNGGGLGYQGVPHSIAIEFDTFENLGNDIGSNHVAVDTNGSLTNAGRTNVYGVANCLIGASHLAPGCLSNGDLWSALIRYDGADLSVSLLDTDREADPFVVYTSFPINIAQTLGTNTAFVGFTAGTGGGFENHDILNWRFANTTQINSLNPVPEPGSATLLDCGIAGLAVYARRRARARRS